MLFTLDKHKARLYAERDMLCCIIGLETLSPMIGGLDNATIHQLAFIDKIHVCIGDTVDVYRYQEYLVDVKPLYLM